MMITLRFRAFLYAFVILLTMEACKTTKPAALPSSFPSFMKQGHRGARGLSPENTIPSMKRAVDEGAGFIELDVYTSRDGKVIVTHDRFVNASHTLDEQGQEISSEEAEKLVFHQMDYDSIRLFDVGSKQHPQFPEQQTERAHIPELGELIDSVEAHTRSNNLPPVIYNVELKNAPDFDGVFNATPEELSEAVYAILSDRGLLDRSYISCFDMRTLKHLHKKYPGFPTGFLTGTAASFSDNIRQLGFAPAIYSPEYKLVNEELIAGCHSKAIKIVPWTVNEKKDMERLTELGVDGIITDFPNLLSEIK